MRKIDRGNTWQAMPLTLSGVNMEKVYKSGAFVIMVASGAGLALALHSIVLFGMCCFHHGFQGFVKI